MRARKRLGEWVGPPPLSMSRAHPGDVRLASAKLHVHVTPVPRALLITIPDVAMPRDALRCNAPDGTVFVFDTPSAVVAGQQLLMYLDPETTQWRCSRMEPLCPTAVSIVVRPEMTLPVPRLRPSAALRMEDYVSDVASRDDLGTDGFRVRVDGSFHDKDRSMSAGVLIDRVDARTGEALTVVRQCYELRHVTGSATMAEAMGLLLGLERVRMLLAMSSITNAPVRVFTDSDNWVKMLNGWAVRRQSITQRLGSLLDAKIVPLLRLGASQVEFAYLPREHSWIRDAHDLARGVGGRICWTWVPTESKRASPT